MTFTMIFLPFSASSVQHEPVQFNTPEPFKQDEIQASNSIEKSEEIFQTSNNKLSEIKSTLWQSLNDRTTTKRPIAKPLTKSPSIKMATERMDLDYSDVNYYIQNNPQNVFRPNLVPSIPDPAGGNHLNNFFPHLTPDITSRNIQEIPSPKINGGKLMTPFLEPPGPRKMPTMVPRIPTPKWANPNGFVPSMNQGRNKIQLGNKDKVSVVVTPMSKQPNIIPMGNRPPTTTRRTTMKPYATDFPDLSHDKFTAQQIIRQQILNRQKNSGGSHQRMDDMQAQPSEQFWLTLKSRGDENMEKMEELLEQRHQKNQNVLFDTMSDLSDLQQKMMPKLQFENILPTSTTKKPRSPPSGMMTTSNPTNQFMLREQIRQKQIEEMNKPTEKGLPKSNIHVFNPGSSGLQVVQNTMPLDEDVFNPGSSQVSQVVQTTMPLDEGDQIFSVGSSMSFGSGPTSTSQNNLIPGSSITVQPASSITIQPEIGVYPKGDDPNILLRQQIQAGTPLPQGPLGPIIPSPRPASFPVTQTPRAPQIFQTVDPRISVTPISRKGDSNNRGSHHLPGPGNYNPPLENSPGALPGNPGSGQQLIKHYLLHTQEQMKHQENIRQRLQDERLKQQETLRQRYQDEMQNSGNINPNTEMNTNNNMLMMMQQQNQVLHQQHANTAPLPSNVLQHRHSGPSNTRRQDVFGDVLPGAAVGALASGLTPISIFSNLLNAYATLDSKHDITSK